MGERIEALIRIPVVIVCYVILQVWEAFTVIGAVFHWFFVVIFGRRSLAKFSNLFAVYEYKLSRYMYFASNARPFPFNSFPREIEKIDAKKK